MIKCRNLCAGYGREEVIRNISWEAEEGLFTAVIGPNGCGKSTLMKALTGQTKCTKGEIFLGKNLLKDLSSREIAKRIAYLPQSRENTGITVERMVLHGRFPYICYPRHYTREDEKKVSEALERVGIAELGHRPVLELSGGERQKAYLAMALVQDAPVLLLDEPAAHLDISAQLELMQMLKSLTGEGKTVVAVLHDLNHALQYAHRLMLIDRGELVRYGTQKVILREKRLEEIFGIEVKVFRDEEEKDNYCFMAVKGQ